MGPFAKAPMDVLVSRFVTAAGNVLPARQGSPEMHLRDFQPSHGSSKRGILSTVPSWMGLLHRRLESARQTVCRRALLYFRSEYFQTRERVGRGRRKMCSRICVPKGIHCRPSLSKRELLPL